MRVALSNVMLLVSLPSGAVSLLGFEPQTHRLVAAGHTAGPQRVAQVFQFGTRLLVIKPPTSSNRIACPSRVSFARTPALSRRSRY